METEDTRVEHGLTLTKEQEERLVTRLHDQSIEIKKENLRKLDARFYPTAPPQRLPKETIEGSVKRQVDQEMARRQAAREEVETQKQRETIPKKISSDAVQGSVERLYTESLAQKQANMTESKKRYLFSGAPVVQKKSSEIHEYVTRLAVPKKREYTVDEINKIYGLV